jgi:hypothetical protein
MMEMTRVKPSTTGSIRDTVKRLSDAGVSASNTRSPAYPTNTPAAAPSAVTKRPSTSDCRNTAQLAPSASRSDVSFDRDAARAMSIATFTQCSRLATRRPRRRNGRNLPHAVVLQRNGRRRAARQLDQCLRHRGDVIPRLLGVTPGRMRPMTASGSAGDRFRMAERRERLR